MPDPAGCHRSACRRTGHKESNGAAALGGLLRILGPFLISAGQNAAASPTPDTSVGFWWCGGVVLTLGGIALTTVNQVAAHRHRRESQRAVGLTAYNVTSVHKPLPLNPKGDADFRRAILS